MYDVDLNWLNKRLINDAISFSQTKQRRQLLFARVRVYIELQSDALGTDRNFLGYPSVPSGPLPGA
jgi:hypothetical protein